MQREQGWLIKDVLSYLKMRRPNSSLIISAIFFLPTLLEWPQNQGSIIPLNHKEFNIF